MGVVSEAYDRVREMPVALKSLRAANARNIYHFKREFRAVNQLSHPNLVGLYQLVRDGEDWYLVMELVRGSNFVDSVASGSSSGQLSRRSSDFQSTWGVSTLRDIVASRSSELFPAPTGDPLSRSHSALIETPELGSRVDPLGATQSPAIGSVAGSPWPSAGATGAHPDASLDPTCQDTVPRVDAASRRNTQSSGDELRSCLPQPPASLPAVSSIVDIAHLEHYLRQLAVALSVLHDAGIVHRDLKPSNVLVTPNHRVVLLDFGFIIELSRGSGEDMIAGTPYYMAPEQFNERVTAPTADWYAFGTVLYQALTGHLPYVGTIDQLRRVKQRTDILPPSALVSDIPWHLDQLCVRCLSRDPRDRPTDREIEALLGTSTSIGFGSASSHEFEEVFVGREPQLDQLRDAYRHAIEEQTAVCVVVSGLSGMGKSALVDRALAEFSNAQVLEGRSYELEEIPYKVFDEIIDDLARELLRYSESERNALIPEDFDALVKLFPALGRAGVHKLIRSPARSYPPDQLPQVAAGALRDLLHRLGGARPMILRSEDLHWADPDSLDLLVEFLREPLPRRMLVVLTVRTEALRDSAIAARLSGALDALHTQLDCRDIEVLSLDADEQKLLIDHLVTDASAFRSMSDLFAEAQGHPMLINEIARVSQSQHAVELDRQDGFKLDDLLWSRVEVLPEAARRVVEVLALAGEPLPESVLARAASMSSARIDRLLITLRQARLIRTSRVEHERWLDFFHQKLREAVVQRIPAEQAAHWHRNLATALSARDDAPDAMCGRHWRLAGDHERAAKYFLKAAKTAAALFAMGSATALYSEVLELISADCRTSDDAERRCRALIGKAQVLRSTNRVAEALELCDEAIAVARTHGLLSEFTSIHSLRGNLLYLLGDFEGCMQAHRHVHDIARLVGSPLLEVKALSGLYDAYMLQGRGLSARDHCRQCIELAHDNELRGTEAISLVVCGYLDHMCNSLRLAEERGHQALELAEQLGDRRVALYAHQGLCWLYWDTGQLEFFRRHLEKLHGLAEQLQVPRVEAVSATMRAQLHAVDGRPDQAAEWVARARAIHRANDVLAVDKPFLLGVEMTLTADRDARRLIATTAESLLGERSTMPIHMFYRRAAIEAAIDAGDWDEVERHSQQLAHYMRQEPLPWGQFLRRWAAAIAERGRRPPGDPSVDGPGDGPGDEQTLRALLDEARQLEHHRVARILEFTLNNPLPWRESFASRRYFADD